MRFSEIRTRNIRYFELTPDIADVGFIIGYILSPDDVFESCGLGMIGVLEPGPGGPPPGGPPPYTGDIPGCNRIAQKLYTCFLSLLTIKYFTISIQILAYR